MIVRGRSGPFLGSLHPRDRGGRFRLKPGHVVPRGRSGKARTDLPAPAPQHGAHAAPGAAKPAGGARERLGRILDSLRQFRDHSREHGLPTAAAARAFAALAALDRLFGTHGKESFHPLFGDPQALIDNWPAVHESLKAITRFATEVGPVAAQTVLQLFTGYARDELPDDDRRLVEAWMRECAWLDAAESGVPGARELAEAASLDANALTGGNHL